MSIDALPCIACGARLMNVWPDCDNQPSEGTAFYTYGHYGSTFFDSFDGQVIEINICDDCLEKNRDRIAWRRSRRGIVCEDIRVGFELLDRPLVPFTGQDDYEDPMSVDIEALCTPMNERVWWNVAACNEARRLAEIRDREERGDA